MSNDKENIDQENKKNIFVQFLEWCKKNYFHYSILLLLFLFIFYNIVNYFLDHNRYFDINKKISLEIKRIYPSTIKSKDDKIIIYNGFMSPNFNTRSDIIEIYDINKNKLKTLIKNKNFNFNNISNIDSEYIQSVFPYKSNKILIITVKNEAFIYDYQINKIKKLDNCNILPYKTSIQLKDENILLVGKQKDKNSNPYIQLLNVEKNATENIGYFPFSINNYLYYQDENDNVYFFGGQTEDFVETNLFKYHPSNHKVIKYNHKTKEIKVVSENENISFNSKTDTVFKIDSKNIMISCRYIEDKELFIYKLNLDNFEISTIYISNEINYIPAFIENNIIYMFDPQNGKLKFLDIYTKNILEVRLNKHFKCHYLNILPLDNKSYILITNYWRKYLHTGTVYTIKTKLQNLE